MFTSMFKATVLLGAITAAKPPKDPSTPHVKETKNSVEKNSAAILALEKMINEQVSALKPAAPTPAAAAAAPAPAPAAPALTVPTAIDEATKARALVKDLVSDTRDVHAWVKQLSDQDPWQKRARQVEITVINKTNNKMLEVKQIRSTIGKTYKPIHMEYGQQIYAIMNVDGKRTEAAPGDSLKGYYASSQEALKLGEQSNLQGVSGSMMISVTDSGIGFGERKRCYLNIAFENAVTKRTACSSSAKLQAFDISITPGTTELRNGEEKPNAQILFDDMTTGDATDINTHPIQIGNEWFVLKAYKKPVTDETLKNAVHYEFTIEQVSEGNTVRDVDSKVTDYGYPAIKVPGDKDVDGRGYVQDKAAFDSIMETLY